MPFSTALPARSSRSRHRSGLPASESSRKTPAVRSRPPVGHPVEFPYRRLDVVSHRPRPAGPASKTACAARGHRSAQPEQLLARRHTCPVPARRRRHDAPRCVTSRSPSAPASIASWTMSRHRGDVVVGGLFVARAAVAHRVATHRAMRDLGAEIDGERPLLDRVEVFGEALPLPRDAFGQRRTRDVLDALHQFDQPLLAAGATGANPTPQLPLTTVVTPCRLDGSSSASQLTCPS